MQTRHKTKPGGARAKELELSEQSALLKEQMQKERDAGAHFQKELQVFSNCKCVNLFLSRHVGCVLYL